MYPSWKCCENSPENEYSQPLEEQDIWRERWRGAYIKKEMDFEMGLKKWVQFYWRGARTFWARKRVISALWVMLIFHWEPHLPPHLPLARTWLQLDYSFCPDSIPLSLDFWVLPQSGLPPSPPVVGTTEQVSVESAPCCVAPLLPLDLDILKILPLPDFMHSFFSVQ